MSWIFDLSDGRKACLYTDRNRILFHVFPVRNRGVPSVIKDDHESGLSSIMYYGTVYFAYVNTEKELIFDGIGSGKYLPVIIYAKQKYDELAGFAGRLQDAAKQWREKYMEEI